LSSRLQSFACPHSHAALLLFCLNDTEPTEIYPLSLHDALPICDAADDGEQRGHARTTAARSRRATSARTRGISSRPYSSASFSGDRKSTRLNSSHLVISYAVFCLKKKKTDVRR